MKGNARKVRPLGQRQGARRLRRRHGRCLHAVRALRSKLEKFGNLTRAAIELAKDWRGIVTCGASRRCCSWADTKNLFVISGNWRRHRAGT
jgi:ATP-dependent HslUV protease subunit HslV